MPPAIVILFVRFPQRVVDTDSRIAIVQREVNPASLEIIRHKKGCLDLSGSQTQPSSQEMETLTRSLSAVWRMSPWLSVVLNPMETVTSPARLKPLRSADSELPRLNSALRETWNANTDVLVQHTHTHKLWSRKWCNSASLCKRPTRESTGQPLLMPTFSSIALNSLCCFRLFMHPLNGWKVMLNLWGDVNHVAQWKRLRFYLATHTDWEEKSQTSPSSLVERHQCSNL